MKWIAFVFLCVIHHQAWSSPVTKLELFVLSSMPVQNALQQHDSISVDVIYLDEVERLEGTVNRNLTRDQEQSAKIVQSYINNPDFAAAMHRAHYNRLKAWRYGIKHLPAAVINDGQGLVYGTTDMQRLVNYIQYEMDQ